MDRWHEAGLFKPGGGEGHTTAGRNNDLTRAGITAKTEFFPVQTGVLHGFYWTIGHREDNTATLNKSAQPLTFTEILLSPGSIYGGSCSTHRAMQRTSIQTLNIWAARRRY